MDFHFPTFIVSLTWTVLDAKGPPAIQLELDPAPVLAAGSGKVPAEPQIEVEWKRHIKVKGSTDLPEDVECDFLVFNADTAEGKQQSQLPSKFRDRKAFRELEQEGLTGIPQIQSCGIFFHRSTSQWHSRYGFHAEINSAPKWSESLRSERRALLIALVSMWEWYAEATKKDTDRLYLAKLKAKLQATSF